MFVRKWHCNIELAYIELANPRMGQKGSQSKWKAIHLNLALRVYEYQVLSWSCQDTENIEFVCRFVRIWEWANTIQKN
jgi:hypothetical protein